MIDPKLIEETCIAFLSGVAPETDKGIEWEINGHPVFITLDDIKAKNATVKWPVNEGPGYWEIIIKKGKLKDLAWKKG